MTPSARCYADGKEIPLCPPCVVWQPAHLPRRHFRLARPVQRSISVTVQRRDPAVTGALHSFAMTLSFHRLHGQSSGLEDVVTRHKCRVFLLPADGSGVAGGDGLS